MGSVLSVVQEMGDPGPRCYELMQCVAYLPGWGDKNFQARLGKAGGWSPGSLVRCLGVVAWRQCPSCQPLFALVTRMPANVACFLLAAAACRC